MDEKTSLGTLLRFHRESKRISLKELAKQTKIREHFLRAIEEDRYEDLPPPIYIKGFLTSYAKVVGLHPKDILQQYDQFLRKDLQPSEERKLRRNWNKRQWGMIGGVLFISLLFSLFFHPYWGIFFKKTPPREIEIKPPSLLQTLPVQEPYIEEDKSLLSLKLVATEKVWIRLRIDDQPERETILHPGEENSFQGLHQIYLHIGNAGGLNLIFNGKPLEKVGKSGEVIHLTFNPQGWEFKSPERGKTP